VARAFLVGLFWCFIPMPFQMVAAAFCAIWLNANMPLSIALVWISNPVTMPPIFYFNYLVGTRLLGAPVEVSTFELDLAWLTDSLKGVGLPLFLGSAVVAVLAATIGYVTIQILWRRRVLKNWQERREARRRRRSDKTQIPR